MLLMLETPFGDRWKASCKLQGCFDSWAGLKGLHGTGTV